jgi:hypothetical protein
VLTRAVPWAGKSHLQILTALMIRGERLPMPSMPPGKGKKAHAAAQRKLVDAMAQCWHAEPNARPSFAHVLTTLEDLMALYFPDEWARSAGAQARTQEQEQEEQQQQEQEEQQDATQ